MKQTNVDDETEVDDLPVSPLLAEGRVNRYGSVPGLDDEELADPDELERQVHREEFGPVLLLPVRGRGSRASGMLAAVDEDGRMDFGAFGSVDFERMQPEFDKARYKAEKLREQVKDLLIQIDTVNQRIREPAKWRVLKYVRMGWLDVDDIVLGDVWLMARLYVRVLRLREEIAELEEVSRERRKWQVRAVWVRYDPRPPEMAA